MDLILVKPKQIGSGLGLQRSQCIMGVEVFLPIWPNARPQPFFSVFSSQVAQRKKFGSQVFLKALFASSAPLKKLCVQDMSEIYLQN